MESVRANKPKAPTLYQIAERLKAHLHGKDGFWDCWQAGAKVRIARLRHSPDLLLTKPQALQCLAFLDAGGTDPQFSSPRDENGNA